MKTPRALCGLAVPKDATLAGYSALWERYQVEANLHLPACVKNHHVKSTRREVGEWMEFDVRLRPNDSLAGHLIFALRHEVLDLLFLNRLFARIPEEEMIEAISSAPKGAKVRQAWFLYEWLTQRELPIPPMSSRAGGYVDLLDKENYYTTNGINSPRHRVRDNLLGVRSFCPVVRKTKFLKELEDERLDAEAQQIASSSDKRLLAKAVSQLVLQDSQATYAIEGEIAPRTKLERFGRAVLQAGRNDLSVTEFERLQTIIVERGFGTTFGIRSEGVFLGERNEDHSPKPEFIGAKPEDLNDLIAGLLEANKRMKESGVPAIIQAAATSFGFVMVHPFEDGNGRIHRFLVHHILAERGFSPPGVIFPVSVVILKEAETYASILKGHSGPLMSFIDWEPTEKYNVMVTNQTVDLYRYFDATAYTEFLGHCVKETIRKELPQEIRKIACFDRAMKTIIDKYDIPDQRVSLLIVLIRDNDWRLSGKKRKSQFPDLPDDMVEEIEAMVENAYTSE